MCYYYVCSPLNAPTEEGIKKNMEAAKSYVKKLSLMTNSRCIAPHSFLPEYFNDNNPMERQMCLSFGLEVLKNSKGIIICGETISSGMQAEMDLASDLGLPFLFYSEDESGVSALEMEGGWKVWQFFKPQTNFAYASR